MRLQVMPGIIYSVEAREVVKNEKGERVWALCDYDNRRILLDAAIVERGERKRRVRHEFYHAVCHHLPGERDEEQQAEFSTTVYDGLDTMVDEGGGWEVLDLVYERYLRSIAGLPASERIAERRRDPEAGIEDFHPLTQVENCESPATRSTAGRAQCGLCETIVSDAAIVTSEPAYSPFVDGVVCERELFCPHCNHVQTWVEGVTLEGMPNGAIVSTPQHVNDRVVVDDFLRRHPLAVGLIAE